MKDRLEMKQNASVQVGRTPVQRPEKSSLGLRGMFEVEHWREGELLGTFKFPNGIVNEGKNNILDVAFDAATQITVWNMLLIDLSGFTALDATDIYDDLDQAGNGFDEFKAYTDPGNAGSTTTRPVWNPDAASGQSISNSSQTIFDITGTGTVKGLGIVGGGALSNIKGNHDADGILWATALFDQGDVAVIAADQLKISYTISS